MTAMDVHYSSATDDWETPVEFFSNLARKYWFVLDVCATEDNAKCYAFYTPEEDGLSQDWAADSLTGVCWMNPPYGREIAKWVKKAYEESQRGAIVVCLLPARTDTRWWHEYVMKGQVTFIKGRLKFSGAKENAPFPNALVVFG